MKRQILRNLRKTEDHGVLTGYTGSWQSARPLYWDGKEDADGIILKNQRQWVGRYLRENMGGKSGNLQKYSVPHTGCLRRRYGTVHPRDAMLPELVLLVTAKIQDWLSEGRLKKQENECILMKMEEFSVLLEECRREGEKGWSKEYREMDEEKLLENVLEYMKNWLMIRIKGEAITVFPAVGRMAGIYPQDYKGGRKNE